MPFSHSSQISTIVGFAETLKPASVLDVGTGMGQYGFLLRNSLEFLNLFEIDGHEGRQRDRSQWRVTIDGIEGYAGYLTPVHHYAYSRMIVGDALALLPEIADGAYELVIAVDILEHFDTAPGLDFLAHCRRIAKRAALVSTPKEFHAQEVEANPLENHRSVWTQAQLATAGYTQVLPNADSWVAVATK